MSVIRTRADVCVVGAGPAGLTIARALGNQDRRVVVLESGGPGPAPGAQELNDGDHEGEPYAGLSRTRHRGTGGTANTWNVDIDGVPGAKYIPLTDRDLVDWPIDLDDLRTAYIEAQHVCGLGPLEYGAAAWATPERRPLDLDARVLRSCIYQFGYARRFTQELVEELRAIDDVTMVTGTTVFELDLESHTVRLIRAMRDDGRVVEVQARIVVLACGAVENARLLLISALPDSNAFSWLGRCFMEHARDFSLTLIPRSPELFADAAFYDLWTSGDGVHVGGHLALSDDALDLYELPNAAMTLVPHATDRRAHRLLDHAPEFMRHAFGLPPRTRYGWSRVRSPQKAFDRFDIVLNVEQRPNPENRIELGARRDRLGNPLPRLVLHWTEREQRSLEHLRELLGEWFRVAGLGQLLSIPGIRPNLSAHHHAGTTRMALDPQDGVVDPTGRVFGVDNLYVTGASVFPSAGFANPVLTIVALAHRLGGHLDTVLAGG